MSEEIALTGRFFLPPLDLPQNPLIFLAISEVILANHAQRRLARISAQNEMRTIYRNGFRNGFGFLQIDGWPERARFALDGAHVVSDILRPSKKLRRQRSTQGLGARIREMLRARENLEEFLLGVRACFERLIVLHKLLARLFSYNTEVRGAFRVITHYPRRVVEEDHARTMLVNFTNRIVRDHSCGHPRTRVLAEWQSVFGSIVPRYA